DGRSCPGGACLAGRCEPSEFECNYHEDCETDNACSRGRCVAGLCDDEALADGTACPGGVCRSGACVTSGATSVTSCRDELDCDDGNFCTVDRCGSGRCSH